MASQRAILESSFPTAWMDYGNMVNNKNAPMEWVDHPWLPDILNDESQKLVVTKGAQIGLSTAEIFRVAHRCVFNKLIWIYVLPTDDLAYDFASLKLEPILALNAIPHNAQSSKTQKAMGLKGDSFLLLNGSFGTRQAIMIDADGLTFDEIDMANPEVITTFQSRLQASKYQWEDTFSTPTTPNVGVSKRFEYSDQKHWFVWCPSCGKSQYLDWPDSVCYDRQIYQCIHCHKEMTDHARRDGEWVAKYPSKEVSGYWVPQMIAPWISAKKLLQVEEFEGRQYFYNFCLGKPYLGSDITVSESALYKCLRDYKAPTDRANTCMGLDQGINRHHYVIGNQQGIFRIGTIEFDRNDERKGFDQAYMLMRDYDVRTCVIDALPDNKMAVEFCGQFPWRVFRCFYKERPMDADPLDFKDKDSFVVADRQRTLQSAVTGFYSGEMNLFLDDTTPEWQEYVKHWTAMFLKTETDKYEQERQVWAADGADHYAHATNYFRMARERNKLHTVRMPSFNPEDTDYQRRMKKAVANKKNPLLISEKTEDFYNDL